MYSVNCYDHILHNFIISLNYVIQSSMALCICIVCAIMSGGKVILLKVTCIKIIIMKINYCFE